jgi:galactonate dehydratase
MGEYLFVDVRTDEEISGWGEINRGIAALWSGQVNDLLTGDAPARIEDTWPTMLRTPAGRSARAGDSRRSAVAEV